MADQNTTPTPEVQAVPPQVALRQEIATRLATSGTQVRGLVVDELTTQEITRRKDAVLKVLSRIDEKSKELKKAEGQGSQNFNAQGEKVGEPSFTKEQVEAMKKMREEIGKLQNALTKAFDEGDFNKVLELGK